MGDPIVEAVKTSAKAPLQILSYAKTENYQPDSELTLRDRTPFSLNVRATNLSLTKQED